MNDSLWSHDGPADHPGWFDLVGPSGDELDKLAVDEALRRRRAGDAVSAIEIDCGECAQVLRLAEAGAEVVAAHPDEVCASLGERARAGNLAARIHPRRINPWHLETLPADPLAPFDLVISHRTLPFMRYADALTFLRQLAAAMKIGGRLYVSAFGLHSDLGDHYPDAEAPVARRYAPLAAAVATRYDLAEPVCLYSERELFTLLFAAGIGVLKTFTTTHGSVKAVGVRI